MSKKILVLGLGLSGLVVGLTWAAPVGAQSALAQQQADQEKAAQQGTKSSSTNAGTAKPAAKSPDAETAKPTATKPTATVAAKPVAAKSSDAATAKPTSTATTTKSAAAKPTTTKASTATTTASTPTVTKPTGTKPAATTTAKSDAAKPAASTPATPKSAAVKPTAKKAPAKPVVYVDDGVNAAASGGDSKNAKPQNRDVAKAFEQSCPDVTVTEEKAKAGYDVTMEREPGSKGVKTAFGLTNVVHKTNKIEVTSKSGKEVFSETGHSTNQLVKDACAAMATPATKVAKN
jgi:hypothetical protein